LGQYSGFIADEVETVLPDLVQTDGDGWKSLHYTGLIPYLVDAVQDTPSKNELEESVHNLNQTVTVEMDTREVALKAEMDTRELALKEKISNMSSEIEILRLQVERLLQQIESFK
jgi:hypothetical protein